MLFGAGLLPNEAGRQAFAGLGSNQRIVFFVYKASTSIEWDGAEAGFISGVH
jgi:hypothetical protein